MDDRQPQQAVQRVQHLIQLGRLQAAFDEATRGLAASPDDPGLLILAAVSALGLKEPVTGHRLAAAAVAVAPTSDVAHATLARAYRQLGRHAEAAQAAYRAVCLDPADWSNHVLYSACALNLPNGREVAWQDARRAVELAPHEPSAHAQIAEAAFPGEYGTPEELALAERALTEALRLDPHDGAIQNDLARVRLARSDSRSALAGFAGAVSADPLRVGAVAMGNVALVVSRIIVIQAAIVFGAVFVGAGLLGKSPSLAGRLVLLALVIALGGFLVVRWRGYLTGAGSRAAVKRVVLDNKRILAGALLVVAAMLALGAGAFLSADGGTGAVGLALVLAGSAVMVVPTR